jgi:hypothetical protein
MATTSLKAYTVTGTTVLSTELNSLTNNSLCSASSAFDNSTNLAIWADFELVLAAQGVARSAGATCTLFMSAAPDGTNYTDATVEGEIAAVFAFDAATTARRHFRRGFELPPLATIKFYLVNSTGQTLAASGNTVKIWTRNLTTA